MTKVEMINELIDMGYTSNKYTASLWKKSKNEIEKIYFEERKKNNMFETRGLGAGSYPEAPERKRKDYKVKVVAEIEVLVTAKDYEEIEESIQNKDYEFDGVVKIIDILSYEEE